MQKNERIVGVGLAMVDEKIRRSGVVLPRQGELIAFLDKQNDAIRETGGVTPNIVSALTSFSPEYNTRLLACTGEDPRGQFYRLRTHNRLGKLQIDPNAPTGVVASLLDETGIVVQRDRSLGAAETIKVDKSELDERNALVITDITTLRLPGVFNEAEKMFTSLQRRGGNFYLNLAGFNPAIASRESLVSVLTALKKTPEIVTGNEDEFSYLTGSNDVVKNLQQTFPDTRLLVLTMAENGSLVRFEGEIIRIPPYRVRKEMVVDETGAGDAYAGILLGALYQKPYAEWAKEDIVQACITAAFGSSLLVQTLRSRLTVEEMILARNFHVAQSTIK